MPHLIEIVADLDRRGIGFRSLTESIDTTTAGGRLTFHIFGALAQFERDIIRERTVAGLEAAAARGRKGGRPKAMGAAKIEAAQRLLAGGMPIKDVAVTLEVGISTLYRYGLAGTAALPQTGTRDARPVMPCPLALVNCMRRACRLPPITPGVLRIEETTLPTGAPPSQKSIVRQSRRPLPIPRKFFGEITAFPLPK